MTRRYQTGDTAGLYIGGVLVLLLLISLAGNAYFWHERDALLQKEATVKQLQADTAAAAGACTASVDKLGAEGRARGVRLESRLSGIAPQVRADAAASMAALAARPDNPSDLCGSLQRFLSRSIVEERGGK